MKTKRSRIVAAVVIVAVVGALVAGYLVSQRSGRTAITTAKATSQSLSLTVSASGSVDATQRVPVYTPIAGTLASVTVTDGQAVTAGQLLATLDAAPLTAAVNQAKAQVSAANAQAQAASAQAGQANAQLVQANAAAKAADAQLVQANAQADQADAQAEQADAQLSAAKALPHDTDALAQARENAIAQARAAQDAASAAQAAAGGVQDSARAAQEQAGGVQKSARAAQDAATAAKNAAAAAQAGAAATLKTAELNATKTTINAPASGTVTFDALAAGGDAKAAPLASVTPAVPVFTIVDLTGLVFAAQVDEADIAGVTAGQKASVTLDAFPGRTFEGSVGEVSTSSVTTKTGGVAFVVKVPLTSSDAVLRLGMSGDVSMATKEIPDALVVPAQAVQAEGTGRYVYRVSGSTVQRVEVTVGAATDTLVQVTSGLTPGDVVATSQLTALSNGATVDVGK